MSSAGNFFLYSMAAFASLIPAIFSSGKLRIACAVIGALSSVLLAATYPKYDAETTRYKQRAHQQSSAGVKPVALQQQERSQ